MDTFDVRDNKCNVCGEEIEYGSRRCPYCGNLVNSDINKQNSGINEGFGNPTSGSTQPYAEPVPQVPDNCQEPISHDEVNNIEKPYQVSHPDPYINQGVLNNGSHINPTNNHINNYNASGKINNMGSRSDIVNPYGDKEINRDYKPLGNGIKVFLTVISTVPWVGQLTAIIAAIIFMNSEYDRDRKSFGLALLIASLTLFVIISCLGCLIAMIAS